MGTSGESLPERVRKVAGREALAGLPEFDPSNPLHIDQVARHLVRKLQDDDDAEAFTVLVDLAHDTLAEVARQAARDVGLAMDSDDLVVAYFTRLLVDVRRPGPEVRQFLKQATDRIREEAEAWVRDFACLELPSADRHDGAVGARRRAEFHAQVVQICFHRLDVELRRLLRAADVERMTPERMAEVFSLGADQVRDQLEVARRRLADAIARALEGGAS